jgi:hypothetical protein
MTRKDREELIAFLSDNECSCDDDSDHAMPALLWKRMQPLLVALVADTAAQSGEEKEPK